MLKANTSLMKHITGMFIVQLACCFENGLTMHIRNTLFIYN